MTFLGLTGFINFLACSFLAAIVFKKSPLETARTGRAYAIFSVTVAAYNLCYFFWQFSTSYHEAKYWFLWLFLGIVWINQAYLKFIFVFLDREKSEATLSKLCCIANIGFSIAGAAGLVYSGFRREYGLGLWPKPTALFNIYLVFWHFQCLYGFYRLVMAFRHSSGIRREQMKYMVVAFAIGFFGGANNWPLWYGVHFPPYLNGLISVYEAVIAYAIVKHRLMDITLLLRKTLIYSTVTGSLMLIYLAVITLFTRLSEGLIGYQSIYSSATAAALITFLFQPLKKRVQEFVDLKFFRQYVDREQKLYELSRDVITHTSPEAMCAALMRVIEETLHPKVGAIYLRHKDSRGFFRAAMVGSATLPEIALDSDPLATYLLERPQPFVQEGITEIAESQSTRDINFRRKPA